MAKATVRFSLTFLVVFGALVYPWAPLRAAYREVFIASGNLVGSLPFFDRIATVRYEAIGDGGSGDGRDIRVVFHHRATGAELPMAVDARFPGYTPTVFMLSLAAAAPFSLKRRGLLVLVNLLVATLYVAFRQGVYIAAVLFADIPDWQKQIRDAAYWVFVESFAGVFVIPLMMFVLVSMRRRDLERFMAGYDLKEPASNIQAGAAATKGVSRQASGSRKKGR